MVKLELFSFLIVLLLSISCSQAAPAKSYSSIGNPEYPKGVNIPSSFTLPDGIVFKFVLYTGGLANYICDTASGQWIEDVFRNIYFNHKEDLTDYPFSEVAYVDFRGNDILLRSAIPSDTSVANVTVLGSSPSSNPANYHDEILLVENTAGKGAFSDITHVILTDWNGGAAPAINLCGTDYPNGYVYASKFTTTLLFYHHKTN
ncbi:putative exported protein [Gigaspora margarita]|uniref:Putative exported protein n=1 Tax=Gigaspora margarita TaxID=4874 RepID=A0A8H4AT15_GIGMA|nr:putative exported protein [Gigaspora margarita]